MKILTMEKFLETAKAAEVKYLLTDVMEANESLLFLLQVPGLGNLTITKALGTLKSPKISGTKQLKGVTQFRLFMAATNVAWAGFFIQFYDACGKNILGADDKGFTFIQASCEHDELKGTMHFITNWESGFTAVGIAEMKQTEKGKTDANKCLLITLPDVECVKSVVTATNFLCKTIGEPQNLLMEGECGEEISIGNGENATSSYDWTDAE